MRPRGRQDGKASVEARKLRLQAISARAHGAKAKKALSRLSAIQCDRMQEFAADKRMLLHRRYNIKVGAQRTSSGRKSRVTAYGFEMALRVQKRHGRAKFILTWDAMSDLGFEKHTSRSTLARMYRISERTVGRNVIYVALVGMNAQLQNLKQLRAAFELTAPEWVICNLMWDETSERLSLNVVPGTSSAQQSSTWEVLVSRITLTWCFGGAIFHTEFIMPPVPLISNKAEHIFAGLFQHHFNKEIQELVRFVLQRASLIGTQIHETDGHPANDRLHFHLMNQETQAARDEFRMPVAQEQIHCTNHCTNLIIVHLVTVIVRENVLNNIYCFVMFLRMGGHFLRIVSSACHLIRTPYFRWNESSAADLEAGGPFCRELGDFIIENYRRDCLEVRHQSPDQLRQNSGLDKFTARVRRCFGEGLNGRIWLRGHLGHTCRRPGCCGSREQAEAKAIECVHFLFRSIPGLPEISKWTKLLPVLMVIMTCCVGGLLEEAFAESAKHFKFRQFPQAAAEQDYQEDANIEWHRLAGGRFRRCRQLVADSSQMFYISTLAIIVEPLRILHSRFMYMSHQVKTDAKIPSFLNELDETHSIVVRVLQYFSSLLALSCSRARLLWQWSGAESGLDWKRQFPEQARRNKNKDTSKHN